MPDNTGILLLGLGALLFLGRGVGPKPVDEDNRLLGGAGGGAPLPPTLPAFNIQGYVDSLFRDTATVPDQPPIQLFFPSATVVTSSGVPAVVPPSPEIITPTTKVVIGGDGGRTIDASSLAVIRSEQIAKQEFAAAANADLRTAPKGAAYFYAATLEANRIEEERQKKFAADLIAKNRAAQATTRKEQEAAVYIPVASRPPTINFDFDDDDWSMSPFSEPGQSISVSGASRSVEVDDVDFSSEGVSNEYVISGGMDSPMVFAGEEEDTFSLSGVQDYGYGVYYGGAEDD